MLWEPSFGAAEAVGDEDSDEGFSFFAWSIGGRYFFNKRNISPYVGGGFSIINVSYEAKGKETSEKPAIIFQ